MLIKNLISPEFKNYAEAFEKELKKEGKDTLYINEHSNYVYECLMYCEQQGVNEVKQINQSLIDSYIVYLEEVRVSSRRGTPLSTGTVNKHKNGIRRLWEYLQNVEGLKLNPLTLREKRYNRKSAVALTHQEIQWLYSVTDTSTIGYRDRCMLALYYGCGLRRGEGIKLLLTDIDFSKGRILIRLPKNKSDRYVIMTPKVQKFIEDYVYSARELYLPENSRCESLFISERGKPMHSETFRCRIESLWRKVKELYNAERDYFGLHTLRHTFGTHLYMAGIAVEKIALLMGHKTLESTQLYIHSANKLKNDKI